MNGQKHIIKREILELTVPDRENAMPLQNKASEFVKYRLNPELDKLFSKLSTSEEVVQIDRFVLDLGNINPKNLDEDFLQIAIKKAEDQLTELIFKTKSESENANRSKAGQKPEKVKIKSLKANYLTQFIHFLESGNLSWWKNDGMINPLSTIFEQVLLIDKSSLQKQLLPLLKQQKVRKRLVYQFSNKQLEILVFRLDVDRSKIKTDFIKEIQSFLTRTRMDFPFSREVFWGSVFEALYDGKILNTDDQKISFLKNMLAEGLKSQSQVSGENPLSVLLKTLVQELQKKGLKDLQLVVIAILEYSLETGLNSKNLLSTLQNSTQEKNREVEEILEWIKQKMKSVDSVQKQIDLAKNSRIEAIEKAESTVKKTVEKENISSQGSQNKLLETNEIFISNAGLVLLHPYLKFFFDGLGLLNKELQFKSFEHTVKAIHLLQFIITKSQSNAEHELSLNKILCGLDISEPIPQKAALTESEMDECENLLSVVLERWEVLKTKKTEALRENFLKRDGLLTSENQGWNLKIERNSIDILLDKLPWGISLIRLPWAEQIIYVEW